MDFPLRSNFSHATGFIHLVERFRRMNKEEYLSGCHSELAKVARDIVDKRIGLVAGSRRIAVLRDEIASELTGLTDPFVAYDSESDHLPIGDVRSEWNSKALREKDAEIARFDELYYREAVAECLEIIDAVARYELRYQTEAFARENACGLAAALSLYLDGATSAPAVQAMIDRIIDRWEQSGLELEPVSACEAPLWWAAWTAQHLCSASHPLSEFRPKIAEIVAVLRGERLLLPGETGRRP